MTDTALHDNLQEPNMEIINIIPMREQCMAHLNRIQQESKARGDSDTQMRAYDVRWIIRTKRLSIGRYWTIIHLNYNELEDLIHNICAPAHADGTRTWLENNIEESYE